MRNRVAKAEKPSNTNRTPGLKEEQINELFDRLKLSTAAEREKFLQLNQFSEDPELGQERATEILRVRSGASTTSAPPPK